MCIRMHNLIYKRNHIQKKIERTFMHIMWLNDKRVQFIVIYALLHTHHRSQREM